LDSLAATLRWKGSLVIPPVFRCTRAEADRSMPQGCPVVQFGVGTPLVVVVDPVPNARPGCDYLGKWEPYGEGHRVHRHWNECEGCMLEVCSEMGMKCVNSITIADVLKDCRDILNQNVNQS